MDDLIDIGIDGVAYTAEPVGIRALVAVLSRVEIAVEWSAEHVRGLAARARQRTS